MNRQLITQEDVMNAIQAEQGRILVNADAVITPAAREAAQNLCIHIEVIGSETPSVLPAHNAQPTNIATAADDDNVLPDIRELNMYSLIPFKNPKDPVALDRLQKSSPARLCLERTGPRNKTKSLLRFAADHAAAVDAAFGDVSQAFLENMKLPVFTSCCTDRDEYLRRPDLGRRIPQDQLDNIRKLIGPNPKVVVIFADGLSSTALENNGPDTYKSLVAGLKRHGIEVAPPLFVRWARVPVQDCISEATGAEVVCSLIGERPGLVTSESLSAYTCYKAYTDIPEAKRTVVSNIYRGGTPAVEAGSYIADIIKMMLEKQVSGMDLVL